MRPSSKCVSRARSGAVGVPVDATPLIAHTAFPRSCAARDGAQDDFYLNVVDWSSTNMLAVGLGRSVYLWSAATGKVTQLHQLPEDTLVASVSWMQRVRQGSRARSLPEHTAATYRQHTAGVPGPVCILWRRRPSRAPTSLLGLTRARSASGT